MWARDRALPGLNRCSLRQDHGVQVSGAQPATWSPAPISAGEAGPPDASNFLSPGGGLRGDGPGEASAPASGLSAGTRVWAVSPLSGREKGPPSSRPPRPRPVRSQHPIQGMRDLGPLASRLRPSCPTCKVGRHFHSCCLKGDWEEGGEESASPLQEPVTKPRAARGQERKRRICVSHSCGERLPLTPGVPAPW